MTQGLRQKLELQKFVSAATLNEVEDSEGGIERGGERRWLTLLFSDIRGFTAFSETREPEEVVEMLNTYLQAQAQVVLKHQGDIDKFVGDELMARFSGPDQEARAARCAVEMMRAVQRINASRGETESAIQIGVGINAADVILGAMGSMHRMDFTAIGDGVNLAARLCSAAAPGQILASGTVEKAASGIPSVAFEPLEPILVKGKREPIPVFSVRLVAGNNPYNDTAVL